MIAISYSVDSQKREGQNDFQTKAFVLEPNVKSTSNNMNMLKSEIQDNRESLAELSHRIEIQFAELQNNILQSKKGDSYDKNDETLNNMTEEDKEEKIIAETNELTNLMEKTLQEKEFDPVWSKHAKQSVYDAFSTDELEGVNLNDADCGSTLCKLSLSLEGTKESGEVYRDIIDRAPWPGQSYVKIDEESGEVEFYLAKEGYELPKSEEEENVL